MERQRLINDVCVPSTAEIAACGHQEFLSRVEAHALDSGAIAGEAPNAARAPDPPHVDSLRTICV